MEQSISIVAELILSKVELDSPARIGEMRERRFSVSAPRDNPPGDAYSRSLLRVSAGARARGVGAVGQKRQRFCRGVLTIVGVGERLDAGGANRFELLPPRPQDEVQIFSHYPAAAPFPESLR